MIAKISSLIIVFSTMEALTMFYLWDSQLTSIIILISFNKLKIIFSKS